MPNYVKMIDNNGQTVKVEQDRVNRFLDEGWKLNEPASEKKSQAKGKKDKISASAEVTSQPVVEEIEQECPECGGDHAYENCDKDEDWDILEDDDIANKED